MSKLRNWRWEKFAQEVAAGGNPREAYTVAGYEPDRANHNRLLRRADVASRIEELRQEREDAACVAGMTAPAVLAVLKGLGLERIDDFFESDAAGVLCVGDHQTVPVETAIAFLRFIRRALGIKTGLP
jgi:phage terminase small subunit